MTAHLLLMELLSSESTDDHTLVHRCAGRIKSLVGRTAQDTVDVGQSLIEAKQHLSQGCFEAWVKAEFGWSLAMANKFSQVAIRFGSANLADLTISTSALSLLAEAATQEDLDHASHGDVITSGAAQEIVNQYKELALSQSANSVTIDVSSELVEPKFS